jgi:hypothetical protein
MMFEEEFTRRLRDSDAAAPTLVVRADLTERVLRRHLRRRAVRRGLATAAVLALLIIPLTWRLEHRRLPVASVADAGKAGVNDPGYKARGGPDLSGPSESDRVQLLIAQTTVDAILLAQSQRQVALPSPIDPAERLKCQSYETAVFLFAVADQMRRDPVQAGQAAKEYRLVEKYFPQSPQAAEASQRLRQMRS